MPCVAYGVVRNNGNWRCKECRTHAVVIGKCIGPHQSTLFRSDLAGKQGINQKLKKKSASSSEGTFRMPDLPILFDTEEEALARGTEFR